MENNLPIESINIYKSWKKCLNNRIIIADIHSGTIDVSDYIYINGESTADKVSNKTTIFITECSDLNINISSKINRFIIEKSMYISSRIINGIIAGIDVLHCKNINFNITNNNVFYLGFGGVSKSNTFIDQDIAINTLISTIDCNIINFIIHIDNRQFCTNSSIFGEFNILFFEKNNTTREIELRSRIPNNS